jgi:[acyl-carrier-protein] S-malonyltransferase
VGRAAVLARARGAKVIPLKVSAPFHCSLMAAARERLAAALNDVAIASPQFPVIANVDAEAKLGADDIRRALVEQVDRPVQWLQTVQRMADVGVTHALELGPGRVLAGLVKRSGSGIRVLSVDSMGSIEKVPEFLQLGS